MVMDDHRDEIAFFATQIATAQIRYCGKANAHEAVELAVDIMEAAEDCGSSTETPTLSVLAADVPDVQEVNIPVQDDGEEDPDAPVSVGIGAEDYDELQDKPVEAVIKEAKWDTPQA